MNHDTQLSEDTPLVAPAWLGSTPIARRREALELMKTAYALLLANHGQAASLAARQGLDAADALSLRFAIDPLPPFTQEESAQIAGRFTEAQLYMQRAVQALGIRDRSALQASLRLVGRSEAVFDSIFDLIALHAVVDNLGKNQELAQRVRQAYELVRASDPSLSHAFGPLADVDLDTGESGLNQLADHAGILVGSPRFWSLDKWLFVVGGVFLLVAAVGGGFGYGWYSLRTSFAYTQAVQTVQTHPDALRELGAPVEIGWIHQGQASDTDQRLEIGVRGPRGSGLLVAKAEKARRRWALVELTLTMNATGTRTNLLKAPP